MALLGSEATLAASIEKHIKSADPTLVQNEKVLSALSTGIATAIIEHLLTAAVVAQGIPVATSGGAGATSAPGKLG